MIKTDRSYKNLLRTAVGATLILAHSHHAKAASSTTIATAISAAARAPLGIAASYTSQSETKSAHIIRIAKNLNRVINGSLMLANSLDAKQEYFVMADIAHDILDAAVETVPLLSEQPEEVAAVAQALNQDPALQKFLYYLEHIRKGALPIAESSCYFINALTAETSQETKRNFALAGSLAATLSDIMDSKKGSIKVKAEGAFLVTKLIAAAYLLATQESLPEAQNNASPQTITPTQQLVVQQQAATATPTPTPAAPAAVPTATQQPTATPAPASIPEAPAAVPTPVQHTVATATPTPTPTTPAPVVAIPAQTQQQPEAIPAVPTAIQQPIAITAVQAQTEQPAPVTVTPAPTTAPSPAAVQAPTQQPHVRTIPAATSASQQQQPSAHVDEQTARANQRFANIVAAQLMAEEPTVTAPAAQQPAAVAQAQQLPSTPAPAVGELVTLRRIDGELVTIRPYAPLRELQPVVAATPAPTRTAAPTAAQAQQLPRTPAPVVAPAANTDAPLTRASGRLRRNTRRVNYRDLGDGRYN